MLVRLASEEDLPTLMALAEQWLNPLWDKQEKEDTLKLILNRENDMWWTHHFIYVAEQFDEVIGFVDFLQWQDWLTHRSKVLIQHVCVTEKYRHLGVATKMLKRIIHDENPSYIFVDTKPDKFPHAEGLYRKVGFKENPRRKWLEKYR